MPPILHARDRFPPVTIQHAVWLYMRSTLSFRGVEDLLAERGIEASYETVRRWVLKFGPTIARRLRQRRPRPRHVQRPAPPDLPPHASGPPCGRDGAMARGGNGGGVRSAGIEMRLR